MFSMLLRLCDYVSVRADYCCLLILQTRGGMNSNQELHVFVTFVLCVYARICTADSHALQSHTHTQSNGFRQDTGTRISSNIL